MLHLIPAPLHRALYRIADRVRRRWWRLRKPVRHSVFVVAFDEAGKALLVRHSYGRPVWTLPGGGRSLREDPAAAMRREFREELQCGLAHVELLAHVVMTDSGSANHRHVFTAELAGTPRPDRREVLEARLFEVADLPADVSAWAASTVQQASQKRSAEGR